MGRRIGAMESAFVTQWLVLALLAVAITALCKRFVK